MSLPDTGPVPGSAPPWGETTCPEAMAEGLSRMPEKRWFYTRESYFREAWSEATAPGPTTALDRLRRHTFVLFKPDGIAARCIAPAVACLAEAGFVPVHHARLRFDRHTIRELWRYELNSASLQRFDAIDLLLTATDSLLLLLRDVSGPGPEQTAADRLRLLKGPSLIHLRKPHHLRSRIGSGTGLLNLIHTPDEPADVIRELGVLLDKPARTEALAAMAREPAPPVELRELEASVYPQAPAHDRDLLGCVERMERACEAVPPRPEVRTVREGCQSARSTRRCDWRSVLRAADAAGLRIEPWDRIVFAAACTETHVPGVEAVLKA